MTTLALLALDPGPTQTAWVTFDGGRPMAFAKADNSDVLALLRASAQRHVVVEMIASYGMAVGAEVFETCVWIGRFLQAADDAGHLCERIFRRDVKLHLCRSARAKDANIRQALLDRFGPGREAAIGKKHKPGPLYGVAGDVWAAIAVACTAFDRRAA